MNTLQPLYLRTLNEREQVVGKGLKVLQIAFYKFCVRLKSVTEQHMDKLKKRLPRQLGQGPGTVYLCLSQSQNYTTEFYA